MGLFQKIKEKLFGDWNDTSTKFTCNDDILKSQNLPHNQFLLADMINELSLCPFVVEHRTKSYFYFPLELQVGNGDNPKFFKRDNIVKFPESVGSGTVIEEITFKELPFKAKESFIINGHFEDYKIDNLNNKLKDEILKEKI